MGLYNSKAIKQNTDAYHIIWNYPFFWSGKNTWPLRIVYKKDADYRMIINPRKTQHRDTKFHYFLYQTERYPSTYDSLGWLFISFITNNNLTTAYNPAM